MDDKLPYTITKVESHCLILGNSCLPIEDYGVLISKDLIEIGFKGEIILDYLLRNGDNSSRLFSAYFDGINIVWQSLVALDRKKSSYITRFANTYYRNHKELLFEKSVLTSTQIHRFLEEFD